MKRIAIIGAGGFLGGRMVERGILGEAFTPVPIIRSPKGAARLSRFGPIWNIVDTSRRDALAKALTGCDAVVNATVGEFDRMRAATEEIWHACVLAGVPRLVHVSTAEVFGRVEDAGLEDDSWPDPKHWMPYARAKIEAEAALRARFADRSTQTVIVRPGLIWGPRSPWVEKPASAMLSGTATLINGGGGIANLIFVDNLIEQMLRIVHDDRTESDVFNVSDDETTTWAQYFAALASEIAVDSSLIHQVSVERYRSTRADLFQAAKQGRAGRWLKGKLSPATKRRIKLALASRPKDPSSNDPGPVVTRGEVHLQTVARKLSNAKYRRIYGKGDEVTFADGIRWSGEWLRFSGFERR